MRPSHLDVLILDMDGVLVDVSKSYRQTIQRTIHLYLKTCLGFRGEIERLITDKEISLFKSVGGFNNDWDLTTGLLLYLLSISDLSPSPKRKKFFSIEESVSYLQTRSSKFSQKTVSRLKKQHLTTFLKKVRSSGGGLRGVRHVLGASWDGWVYPSGDLDRENLVKRIFQEVYLGKKFVSHYHLSPLFYKGKGLFLRERVLIPKKILATLHKKLHMGIASGRPRFEAELALKRFRLLPYFDSIVTLDECEEEENRILHSTGRKINCSKPHPYSLLRAIRETGIPDPRCAYVGDVPDDMLAAKSAKKEFQILAIGLIRSCHPQKAMKEALIRAGADRVIEDPTELLQFIS